MTVELSFDEAHPELANCIITALLWSLGDIIAQLFERHTATSRPAANSINKSGHTLLPQSPGGTVQPIIPGLWSFDFVRTLRIASYAGLLFAPVTKKWFELLVEIYPGEGFIVALKRMVTDQGLYSACVITSLFTWVGLLESGFSLDHTWKKIRTDFWPTLQKNWMLWPIVQTINLGFVPLEYRMIVGAVINVPWTAYLAWVASSKSTAPPTPLEMSSRV